MRSYTYQRLSESVLLRFSGHVLDFPKMWSGGNLLRSTLDNKILLDFSSSLLRVGTSFLLAYGRDLNHPNYSGVMV